MYVYLNSKSSIRIDKKVETIKLKFNPIWTF